MAGGQFGQLVSATSVNGIRVVQERIRLVSCFIPFPLLFYLMFTLPLSPPSFRVRRPAHDERAVENEEGG